MSVPFIFANRAVPVSAFDIDANKINADFAALADGSAIDLAAIDLSKLSPDVFAAIGGFLMNFLINGSYESFTTGIFQRWTFDDTADPTASIAQASGAGNFRFGQKSAEITTGTGPAGTLLFYQSLQNFSDLAGLTMSSSVFVKAGAIGTIRIRIFDGVGSTVSAFNVNSGVWEKLSVTHSVDPLNTELTVRIEVDQPGAVAQIHLIDGAMLVLGATAINYQPGLSPMDALAGVAQVYNQTVSPAPNGFITLFTLDGGTTFVPGKVQVYLRTLRMVPGLDYNEVAPNQILFLAAQIPETGDNIRVDCIEPLI